MTRRRGTLVIIQSLLGVILLAAWLSLVDLREVGRTLSQAMWGYQGNAFFSREAEDVEFGTPRVVDELAKWFGIEYAFLERDLDRTDIYKAGGWEMIAADMYGSVPYELWRFPEAPALATLSSRPAVLVISRSDMPAYEQLFRVATRGAIPYEEAWIVQGEKSVDAYTLDELQRFDAIFLTGYGYEDSRKAWDLLGQYVRQGGALYVDTGWQWTVPEWEFEQTPAVLPVARLSWRNYGVSNEYSLESSEVGGDVDPAKFDALDWDGQPWGVSGADRGEVRDWGQVVLSVQGQPLVVAGQYGEGRVIWSGMNLVAHTLDKNNEEEGRLLHNLVAWLLGSGQDFPAVVVRQSPDRVQFHMDVPAGQRLRLYWREAQYPAWHAYLQSDGQSSQELPIYRWGPGFMMMPVSAQAGNVSVRLVWKTPFTERLAAVVSLLTLGGLLAFVLDGVLLDGRLSAGLLRRAGRSLRRTRSQGSVEWLLADTSRADLGKAAVSGQQEVLTPTAVAAKGVGTDALMPFAVPIEIAREVDVGALWEQWVGSGKASPVQDTLADNMIAWWRRVRESGEHGH